MYEQSARWNEFYQELDPPRRSQMFMELSATDDDGANRYRQLLLDVRHGENKHFGGNVDRFLFQFVNMVQLYRSAKLFKRNARREVRKAMKELLWTEASQYGEAGERALYWELRNAAMRYFKVCEDPGYNRGLFGMLASSDAGRRERVRKEVWQMTQGLSERTGMEEELRLWNRAVLDAFSRFYGGDMKIRSE